MRNFSYSRAGTSQEALTLIATIPNAKFLGGGTNLVDLMRENIEQPDALIDVTRLPSAGITESATGGVSSAGSSPPLRAWTIGISSLSSLGAATAEVCRARRAWLQASAFPATRARAQLSAKQTQ